ncbi:Mini-ribonuclease 3 [Acetohalobium arabaticum]|uniref:Mini-ribonuclease 3 n=1 Tax=Acetohalobium arabaticum (strain ATCC 49924 / DSM 5501 / Z-7288) TaxID=574087 RepID=D9QT05_ACEAZ|nr:ribonuclease III domain-containing protein [Acetohalobium arabaticum]ADL11693.1 ribonuclease III [Acetohalobium arabaticum DSM 5501]
MFNDILELPERPRLFSPETMAYIGDSIYEVFIRSYLIEQGLRKGNSLHQQAVKYVNAGAQAELLQQLESYLTEEEEAIVRRGRNSNSGSVPKNADVVDYRYSTAFEALLGYLYLEGKKVRLEEVLTEIKGIIDEIE